MLTGLCEGNVACCAGVEAVGLCGGVAWLLADLATESSPGNVACCAGFEAVCFSVEGPVALLAGVGLCDATDDDVFEGTGNELSSLDFVSVFLDGCVSGCFLPDFDVDGGPAEAGVSLCVDEAGLWGEGTTCTTSISPGEAEINKFHKLEIHPSTYPSV